MLVAIAALIAASAAPSPPDRDDDDKPKAEQPLRPAEQAADADEGDDDEEGQASDSPIVITARKLDAARTGIDASLGASVYSLTNEAIENRPGGETGSVSDILLQAPGVTLSGKTLNVRGSPANQVRINNVIVPEAITDPADQLSSRLSETTRLLTGTLPAQYGFAPAGVISITTKNGLYQHGGQAELFAGSDGMFEPAIEWAGSAAQTSLFASGTFEHDRSTVADASRTRARDRRNELEGLGFADHVIDSSNRVSLIFGGSHARHRFGPTGIGAGTETSGDGYAVGTFQHSAAGLTVQASLFGGIASDHAEFNEHTRESRRTFGTQVDTSEELGAAHTLRFGLLASRSTLHERAPGGDWSAGSRTAAAIYVQDEWKISPSLTFNPGARVEWLRHGSAAKVEPRASLVWASPSGLTAHAGYARYAAAPPLGEQPAGAKLPDERDDYFDAGIQQKLGALTLGVDGYWRSAHNYIAEHLMPGSALPTAFAFDRARIRGVELSATYAKGPVSAWGNLSLARAKARTIIGGEATFAPEVLAAASARWTALAGDRPVTASGGLTLRLGRLSLSGDVLASSGAVRTLYPTDPNGDRHSPCALLGLAAVYHVRILSGPADIRLDLTNLTDGHYVTSDAASLEGGWTRLGRGRAIAIGIEQGF